MSPSALPQDEDEDLQSVRLSWDQAWEMFRKGELHDAKTIVGLSLARAWLEGSGTNG